jgi:hypothetical protein
MYDMSCRADSQTHKNMRKYALKYAHTIITRANGHEVDPPVFGWVELSGWKFDFQLSINKLNYVTQWHF